MDAALFKASGQAPKWNFHKYLLDRNGKVLGSYASGFCGGMALTVVALAVSRMRSAPPAITMILPGFWLLVPGSMGLIGVTELFGADGDSALPATLISMISVAFGLQAGLVLWQVTRRRSTR